MFYAYSGIRYYNKIYILIIYSSKHSYKLMILTEILTKLRQISCLFIDFLVTAHLLDYKPLVYNPSLIPSKKKKMIKEARSKRVNLAIVKPIGDTIKFK